MLCVSVVCEHVCVVHVGRVCVVCERRALFGRRRSGSSGNGTGSSRRSSRGQPTQESILGPISMTIYINMNDGDSDAMDNDYFD